MSQDEQDIDRDLAETFHEVARKGWVVDENGVIIELSAADRADPAKWWEGLGL